MREALPEQPERRQIDAAGVGRPPGRPSLLRRAGRRPEADEDKRALTGPAPKAPSDYPTLVSAGAVVSRRLLPARTPSRS